ncbi:uncharacterized protein LOC142320919 [Lycorma delicatula]|uniref:uncharacterized protein LOC142320919 n=1 Tax=Lycorma delicatula TaxID=130591 RepID=UPI003F5132AE
MKRYKYGGQPVRDASRRLGGILRTARKLGVPEHETVKLPGAKRLCSGHERWPGIFLSLSLFLGAVILLYICSAIPSAFHCPRNSSAEIQTVRSGLDHEEADSWLPSLHLRKDR